MVWQHFTKYDRELFTHKDGKKVHAGYEKRALCIHCGADLKADSSYNGTSTLRRHVQKVCKKYAGRENIDDGQAVIAGDGQADPEMEVQKVWTQDRCVKAACEMIIIDELPFSHVEREGFRHFCRVAVPQFNPVSRRTIVRCFWKLYDEKKEELRKVLSSQRVCLTTDT